MTDCLVTVTDSRFLPGTETLLFSFVKHNPWFSGELIVIHDDLSDQEQARLRRLGAVQFIRPQSVLLEHIAAVAKAIPAFAPIQRRFFSIEVFGLEGRSRAVFLDSDMLCLGSIEPLFRSEHAMVACPDQFHFRAAGPARDLHASRYYGRPIEGSFNGGMISVAPAYLNRQTYQAILTQLDPRRWDAVDTTFSITIQLVLNTYFEGKVSLASAKYNYLVPLEQDIGARTGLQFEDIVQMHFVGVPKPWQESERRQAVRANPALQKFYAAWEGLRRECLALA